jgi:hypothetical protein
MNRRRTAGIALALGLFAGTAQAQYDYGKGGYGRSSGGQGGWVVFLEAALANPRNADNVVATEVVGSQVTPIIPVWDDDFAGRLGLGYQWESGTKIMATVWSYETDQSLRQSRPVAFGIGPPIATGVDDGYIGDTGNFFDVTTEITARTADLAWGRSHELSEGFTLDWSLGARYAKFEETHLGEYRDGTFVFAAAKGLEGEMVGARIALRGAWRFGVFSVNGGMGWSFLDGEIAAASSLSPTPSSYAASGASLTDDSRSGSIRDIDASIVWHAVDDRVTVWLGWEQAEWEDIAADVLRNFPGTVVPLRDRDAVNFSSFKLGVGFRF